jgi:hypothetical protein
MHNVDGRGTSVFSAEHDKPLGIRVFDFSRNVVGDTVDWMF